MGQMFSGRLVPSSAVPTPWLLGGAVMWLKVTRGVCDDVFSKVEGKKSLLRKLGVVGNQFGLANLYLKSEISASPNCRLQMSPWNELTA